MFHEGSGQDRSELPSGGLAVTDQVVNVAFLERGGSHPGIDFILIGDRHFQAQPVPRCHGQASLSRVALADDFAASRLQRKPSRTLAVHVLPGHGLNARVIRYASEIGENALADVFEEIRGIGPALRRDRHRSCRKHDCEREGDSHLHQQYT
jgi:hypothetical protein